MAAKRPGQKDELTRSVRELGRTRIEIVPRDSQSVFVYWEVANTGTGDGASPSPTFTIEIQSKPDDEVVHLFETNERLDGRIVEVAAGHSYGAVLSMNDDDDLLRLARSSTLAGPKKSDDGDAEFFRVQPGDSGLQTSAEDNPGRRPLRFDPESTDSSNR